MALSNAEKQARWRARHAGQRQQASRLAALLLRRSRSDGEQIKTKVGWNDVAFDRYFLRLAWVLCTILGSDRAVNSFAGRWRRASTSAKRGAGTSVTPPSLSRNVTKRSEVDGSTTDR